MLHLILSDKAIAISACLTPLYLLVTSPIGFAQELPPSIDPGRIDQELRPPRPSEPPDRIEVPDIPDAIAPPGAEEQRFVLQDVVIRGVTVYAPEVIQSFYQDLLGQEISLADLYDIANTITGRYRADGYFLSRAIVPEQVIENGVVTLEVIEGSIERVEFQGAPDAQLQRLQPYADRITAAQPITTRVLERNLLLMGDQAGLSLTSSLAAGSGPGQVLLTVEAEYDAVSPFASFNNRGTESVGPLRLQAGTYLNSLLAQGERILISGNTTPNDISELANVQVGVSFPVGHDGLVVDVNGSYTAIRPGGELRSLDINGSSSNLSMGLAYPLIRSRQRNLYATASFDALNSETTIGPQQVAISRDRLRAIRLGLNGDISDPNGVTSGSAQVSQGIGGLGATTAGTPEAPLSRAEGAADFTTLNVNVSRLQRLPQQFNLLVSGRAQITRSPLLSSERFGLGGVSLGSAFDSSQITGDSGYGLRAELQRPFFYQGWGTDLSTRPYVFADYGQVFNIRPTAAEQGTDSLGSVGLGLRQGFADWGSLNLELAFPTVRPSNSQSAGTRLFFGLDLAY